MSFTRRDRACVDLAMSVILSALSLGVSTAGHLLRNQGSR